MSQGQQAGQHLQELSQQLQQLDQVQSQLRTQLEAARAQREAVKDAIGALDEIEDGAVVQVPLGADTYVKARIEDIDDIIVTIGADYAAEQSREEAVSLLDTRIEHIADRIGQIEETLSDVESDIQQIEGQAEQLRQQLAQQQQQQQQVGGFDPSGLGPQSG